MLTFTPPLSHLPPLFQKTRDFEYLATCITPVLQDLFTEIFSFEKELNIFTCSTLGIEEWEKVYKIIPNSSLTLDARRQRIINYFLESLPFTIAYLEEKLSFISQGYPFILIESVSDFSLTILLSLNKKEVIPQIQEFLSRILPCNIQLFLGLRYNLHRDFFSFTHHDLSSKSHFHIKEEVL